MSMHDRFGIHQKNEDIQKLSTPEGFIEAFPPGTILELYGTSRKNPYFLKVRKWKELKNEQILIIDTVSIVSKAQYSIILTFSRGLIFLHSQLGNGESIYDTVSTLSKYDSTIPIIKRTHAHLAAHMPSGGLIQNEGFSRVKMSNEIGDKLFRKYLHG